VVEGFRICKIKKIKFLCETFYSIWIGRDCERHDIFLETENSLKMCSSIKKETSVYLKATV